MMSIHLSFTPSPDQIQPKKFMFFAQVHYTIYPEMIEEFGADMYAGQGGNPHVSTHMMVLEPPEENQ